MVLATAILVLMGLIVRCDAFLKRAKYKIAAIIVQVTAVASILHAFATVNGLENFAILRSFPFSIGRTRALKVALATEIALTEFARVIRAGLVHTAPQVQLT